jgi:GNAT superfamily N-acetyltransferase
VTVRPLTPSDAPACDAIIAGLPYFFGQEQGIRDCAEAVRTRPGWVAVREGEVVGFLTLDHPLPASPEITWMAVHPTARRTGVGRRLIERAVAELSATNAELLSVLTLAESEPEPGTDNYSGTRAFYRRMGFRPVRELCPEGWVQRALLLVHPLDR